MSPPAVHPAYESWSIRKPEVRAAGGVVASQHYLASEIGARVLKDGGNAVDAVVATGLAIGTVEPWMSGLGGGGFMIVHVAAERRAWAVLPCEPESRRLRDFRRHAGRCRMRDLALGACGRCGVT